MSKAEIEAEFEKLSAEEQRELFVSLAERIIARQGDAAECCLGKKLSFDQACDIVFRENHELFTLLAK
jgi:hypothetical protein